MSQDGKRVHGTTFLSDAVRCGAVRKSAIWPLRKSHRTAPHGTILEILISNTPHDETKVRTAP